MRSGKELEAKPKSAIVEKNGWARIDGDIESEKSYAAIKACSCGPNIRAPREPSAAWTLPMPFPCFTRNREA